jgi:predicted ester cyclase
MRVATTDITDMMNPGTERRMDLPGFADEFVDFPHYIIRITERIWHDRQVEQCLEWYSEDCAIHTLAGPITGAQTVVENTWATLAAFPDRRLDGDNVIWSDEGDGSFLSSHLITSKMTNLGDSDFGPATGKKVLVRTIADCLCRENRIVEEWLVRDNLALVEQLGFDARVVAARQAARDAERARPLVEVLAPYHAEALAGADAAPHSQAQRIATDLLRACWQHGDEARAAALSDFRLNAWVPGGRFLYGPDSHAEWRAPIRAAFGSRSRLRIEHIAEVPYLGEARDVALRWSLAGWHESAGAYGEPTGAPLLIMAVSHFRVIDGRVREEVTVWDDIAVLRQIAGAPLQVSDHLVGS